MKRIGSLNLLKAKAYKNICMIKLSNGQYLGKKQYNFEKFDVFMGCFDIIYRYVANCGYKAFEADIISLRSFCCNVAYALTRAKN